MTRGHPERLFLWLDRAFPAVWLAFPVYAWITVRQILGQADQLAGLGPDEAGCVAWLPLVQNFTPAGKLAFWSVFAVNVAVCAGLPAMARSVIRGCARGRMFVEPPVRMLWWIAVVITLFPVLELALSNLIGDLPVATGDLPTFSPDLAFDVTVVGVGLLLWAIAVAMRQAVRLHRDAGRTIRPARGMGGRR